MPRGKRLPRVLFTFFRGDRKAAAKVGWFVGHPDIRGWVVLIGCLKSKKYER